MKRRYINYAGFRPITAQYRVTGPGGPIRAQGLVADRARGVFRDQYVIHMLGGGGVYHSTVVDMSIINKHHQIGGGD